VISLGPARLARAPAHVTQCTGLIAHSQDGTGPA